MTIFIVVDSLKPGCETVVATLLCIPDVWHSYRAIDDPTSKAKLHHLCLIQSIASLAGHSRQISKRRNRARPGHCIAHTQTVQEFKRIKTQPRSRSWQVGYGTNYGCRPSTRCSTSYLTKQMASSANDLPAVMGAAGLPSLFSDSSRTMAEPTTPDAPNTMEPLPDSDITGWKCYSGMRACCCRPILCEAVQTLWVCSSVRVSMMLKGIAFCRRD